MSNHFKQILTQRGFYATRKDCVYATDYIFFPVKLHIIKLDKHRHVWVSR